MDETNSRARSFGLRPDDYHAHRPGYPADAIHWTLAAGTRAVREVLDLAAGTGKLTGNLLDLGFEVTAVEPDDGMHGELVREYPDVPAPAGTAEAIPLPDASVDAVLVGQAFHWFDLDAALTEIARVLRPGGALGILWNGEDPDVDWVGELVEVSRTSVHRGWQGELELPAHESFGDAERTVFRHAMRLTVDSTADYLGTHSRLLVVDEQERALTLARVREHLRGHHRTATGEFDLPMVTEALRLRRHQTPFTRRDHH